MGEGEGGGENGGRRGWSGEGKNIVRRRVLRETERGSK